MYSDPFISNAHQAAVVRKNALSPSASPSKNGKKWGQSTFKRIKYSDPFISGSVYVLQGAGTDAAIDFRDFELLRMGYSPQQISKFNSVSISTWQ